MRRAFARLSIIGGLLLVAAVLLDWVATRRMASERAANDGATDATLDAADDGECADDALPAGLHRPEDHDDDDTTPTHPAGSWRAVGTLAAARRPDIDVVVEPAHMSVVDVVVAPAHTSAVDQAVAAVPHAANAVAGDDDTDAPIAARRGIAGRIAPRTLFTWAWMIALIWVLGMGAEKLGIPAPHLLSAIVVGLLGAITGVIKLKMPKQGYWGAQALTGVVIGSYLDVGSLQKAGSSLPALAAITGVTLVLSIGVGLLLSRSKLVDPATGALGLVAGGSAGMVAASDELGADARTVAFLQYLRLMLVVLATPILVRTLLAPHGNFLALGVQEVEGDTSLLTYPITIGLALAGAWFGRVFRLPQAMLCGPLLLTAGFSATGAMQGLTPPDMIREIAFMAIGLEVGLRFTKEAVRQMRRLMPLAIASALVVTVACGLLAVALTRMTNIGLLDAYLATTPGGINAIMATAVATKANVSLVFAIQTLRLFAMVLLAPPLVRLLLHRRSRTSGAVAAATA